MAAAGQDAKSKHRRATGKQLAAVSASGDVDEAYLTWRKGHTEAVDLDPNAPYGSVVYPTRPHIDANEEEEEEAQEEAAEEEEDGQQQQQASSTPGQSLVSDQNAYLDKPRSDLVGRNVLHPGSARFEPGTHMQTLPLPTFNGAATAGHGASHIVDLTRPLYDVSSVDGKQFVNQLHPAVINLAVRVTVGQLLDAAASGQPIAVRVPERVFVPNKYLTRDFDDIAGARAEGERDEERIAADLSEIVMVSEALLTAYNNKAPVQVGLRLRTGDETASASSMQQQRGQDGRSYLAVLQPQFASDHATRVAGLVGVHSSQVLKKLGSATEASLRAQTESAATATGFAAEAARRALDAEGYNPTRYTLVPERKISDGTPSEVYQNLTKIAKIKPVVIGRQPYFPTESVDRVIKKLLTAVKTAPKFNRRNVSIELHVSNQSAGGAAADASSRSTQALLGVDRNAVHTISSQIVFYVKTHRVVAASSADSANGH